MSRRLHNHHILRWCWLFTLIVLYCLLTGYQLGLPGLHYDEAREAGLNAMELLTGAPVTAFRQATISFWGWHLPLMVQDYIGASNVYLALPSLALTGIGVPNLRVVAIITGLVALLLLERTIQTWVQINSLPSGVARPSGIDSAQGIADTLLVPSPPSWAGLLALTLLVVSPSFVFWSRQGIFVTNLTQPLVLWALWHGLRWLQVRRFRYLLSTAFAAGAAIYAKLLAVWVLAPFLFLAICYWLANRKDTHHRADHQTETIAQDYKLSHRIYKPLLVVLFFFLPLTPLLLFNGQTGGTFLSVGGNFTQSYYGVSNFEFRENFIVRWQQFLQILGGDQFLYLGERYTNWLAPWLAAILLLLACWYNWRMMLPPIILLVGAFLASLFTVSGLFVTHYALLQPIVMAVVGCAAWVLISGPTSNGKHDLLPTAFPTDRPKNKMRSPPFFVAICFLLWFCFDVNNTIRYHLSLSQSGGRGDHTDATYHLAYYLRYNGFGAPVALDWGIDATVRYLSEGKVQPIEIFGYESLQQPDAGYTGRLAQFLDNPNNVFLLRAPEQTVFAGRRQQFLQTVIRRGQTAQLEQQFSQRDGTPIFELWRVK